MLKVQGTLVGFLLLSGSLWAQNSTPANPATIDPATVTLLVQQVTALQLETSELREKVKALEAERANSSPPAPEAQATVPQPVRATPESIPTDSIPALIAALHGVHGIQWRGFGEFNYKVLDQRQPELGTFGFVPGSAGNFYTGDFDLLLTSRISERASVLSEMVFGQLDAQRFDVDLERVLLKYDYNDHLKISVGRYHTGIGYYNTAFHSGKWLQTTADRPLIMEFSAEGGLLPTQAVGVSVTGMIPSGTLGLNYIAEYGSSDTIRPDINGSGNLTDENNGNHINIGFFVRPDALPGLQIGGTFYHDKIGDAAAQSPVRFGQSIVNGHVVYVAHGIEILNEGFLIRHVSDNGQMVFNMPGFYSQFSKRFGRIRPFFRYQYVNTNENDSIFNDVGLRFGPSFGVRYDFNDNIAFKAQGDHTAREDKPKLNGLQLQLAFTF